MTDLRLLAELPAGRVEPAPGVVPVVVAEAAGEAPIEQVPGDRKSVV